MFRTFSIPSTVADVDAHNDEYSVTLAALDQYFKPKVNVPYERHLFRQIRQESHESVSQFATRLSKQAEYCDFEERKEEYIRDQIIENCKSVAMRKAFLEKRDLTLTQLLDIARAKEAAERQANVMEANPPSSSGIKTSVCAVTKNSDKPVRSTPVVNCTDVDVKITALEIHSVQHVAKHVVRVPSLVILQHSASQKLLV